MKFKLLFFLICPLTLFAQGKLKITGKIAGLKDGTRVSLVDANNPTDTLSKGISKAGAFVLSGSLKEPMLVNLNLGTNKMFRSFLSNDAVKITGDLAKVEQLNISGSATHNDFKDFRTAFDPLFEKLTSISQQVQMVGQTDSIMGVLDVVRKQTQAAVDVFIGKHKASPVSAFLLAITLQLNDDMALADQRLNSLNPAALENTYGKYLQETISVSKATAVGSVAADFTQTDTSGAQVSLSSFRGKYVLLDFWASWCGPCRQENPNVVANYNKFSAKNFTVLGVSLDRPGQKQKWLDAIHADNLTWTQVSDLQFWNNAVAQQYKIESIPQNFLIGPDGKIIAKNLRGPDLEKKLCEMLGCN